MSNSMKIFNVLTAKIDFPLAEGFNEVLKDAAKDIVEQVNHSLAEKNIKVDNLGAYMLAKENGKFNEDIGDVIFVGSYDDAYDFFLKVPEIEKISGKVNTVSYEEKGEITYLPYIVSVNLFADIEIDCYLFGLTSEKSFFLETIGKMKDALNKYNAIVKDDKTDKA